MTHYLWTRHYRFLISIWVKKKQTKKPKSTPPKTPGLILTHRASSQQIDHKDNPALPREQDCMDHLYWNAIHLEKHKIGSFT